MDSVLFEKTFTTIDEESVTLQLIEETDYDRNSHWPYTQTLAISDEERKTVIAYFRLGKAEALTPENRIALDLIRDQIVTLYQTILSTATQVEDLPYFKKNIFILNFQVRNLSKELMGATVIETFLNAYRKHFEAQKTSYRFVNLLSNDWAKHYSTSIYKRRIAPERYRKVLENFATNQKTVLHLEKELLNSIGLTGEKLAKFYSNFPFYIFGAPKNRPYLQKVLQDLRKENFYFLDEDYETGGMFFADPKLRDYLEPLNKSICPIHYLELQHNENSFTYCSTMDEETLLNSIFMEQNNIAQNYDFFDMNVTKVLLEAPLKHNVFFSLLNGASSYSLDLINNYNKKCEGLTVEESFKVASEIFEAPSYATLRAHLQEIDALLKNVLGEDRRDNIWRNNNLRRIFLKFLFENPQHEEFLKKFFREFAQVRSDDFLVGDLHNSYFDLLSYFMVNFNQAKKMMSMDQFFPTGRTGGVPEAIWDLKLDADFIKNRDSLIKALQEVLSVKDIMALVKWISLEADRRLNRQIVDKIKTIKKDNREMPIEWVIELL